MAVSRRAVQQAFILAWTRRAQAWAKHWFKNSLGATLGVQHRIAAGAGDADCDGIAVSATCAGQNPEFEMKAFEVIGLHLGRRLQKRLKASWASARRKAPK